MTRGAWVGLVVLSLSALLAYGWAQNLRKQARRDQAEIDKTVQGEADFAASLQKIRDKTRVLIDPLEELLATDRALIAAGHPPMSGSEFLERLRDANSRMVGTTLEKFIDPCRQRQEIEKHYLYEGKRPPRVELPGWDRPCPPSRH